MIQLKIKEGASVLNGEKKTYYKVDIQRGPIIDSKKMQHNIAQATGVPEAQVHAVLEFMWPAILNELEDGQTVQLGNITIQPSLSAKTHDRAEDCSAADVEVLRFNLIPSKELNAGRKAVTYTLPSTKGKSDSDTPNTPATPDTGNGGERD